MYVEFSREIRTQHQPHIARLLTDRDRTGRTRSDLRIWHTDGAARRRASASLDGAKRTVVTDWRATALTARTFT